MRLLVETVEDVLNWYRRMKLRRIFENSIKTLENKEMSNNKIKVKIELTEKQLEYLCVALFEFGKSIPIDSKERMFKVVQEKLWNAKHVIESERNFFLEKAYYKAAMKVKK